MECGYVEPSRRPADGRYGENPNRLYQHHQFQVVMKPSPSNIQELYLESLENWESIFGTRYSFLLRTTGKIHLLVQLVLAWEVWLDGMEITQFTYFQQVGGLATGPMTAGSYLWFWSVWLLTFKK